MPLSSPITYKDLTGKRLSDRDFQDLLASFDPFPTFRMLAMINTLLSFYEHEDEKTAIEVHKFLLSNLTDESLFKKAQDKFGKESIRGRPVFHAQQLLPVMRRIITEGVTGVLDPNKDEKVRHELGKACLIFNDLLDDEKQSARLQELIEAKDDEKISNELFAQLIASSEVSNPAEVIHSVVRSFEYSRMIDEHPEKFVLSSGESLLDKFRSITGLELRRYIFLLFGIFVVYRSEADHYQDLIANPAKFNIGLDTVFANTNVNEAELSAFFNQTALDLQTLAKRFQDGKARAPLRSELDLTAFRSFPLVYVRDDKKVATTVDFSFLTEKSSVGIFHTIFNAVKGSANDDWHTFTGYWGEIFESYVNGRLRDVYPLAEKRFYASTNFDRPPKKSEPHAFDGAVDYGTSLAVMEYKGTYLTREAKYSGDVDELMKDFDKNIGKAVRQLANNIELVFGDQRLTFSQFNETNDQLLYSFDEASSRTVNKVYPVIIAQDHSLTIGLANHIARRQFEKEKQRLKLRAELSIMPLSLLTVEDLEKTIPHLTDFTLLEVLDEYASRDQTPVHTFINALVRLLIEKRIEQRDNEWILERLGQVKETMKVELEMK
jgi:hypothetical protein